MVDSMLVRFKKARVEEMPLNIRINWNAGTACVSECMLKTLACRGLRVGPSKFGTGLLSKMSIFLERQEMPEIPEIPQSVENKGESVRFLESLKSGKLT